MITLVATPGAADANSYCTLAFANAYHEAQLHNTDWFSKVQEELAAALIVATQYIDLFEYRGRPASTQPLKFPRSGLVVDSYVLASDGVPMQVQQACAQIALDYLRDDFAARKTSTSSVQGAIKSIKAGSFNITYGGDGATVSETSQVSFLSDYARLLLKPLLGRNHAGHGLVRV